MFDRKFTLRHVIKKFPELTVEYSPVEEHFGVPWKMCVKHEADSFSLYVHCTRENDEARPWSVDVDFMLRVISVAGKGKLSKSSSREFTTTSASWGWKNFSSWDEAIKNYMINDTVTVECEVTIKKMTGIAQKRKIDFREPREHLTDVVLKVGEEKFNVLKGFLATVSPYFNALFFGNFAESSKSEVRLEDVDPEQFQSFLEAIHGESSITKENVENLLMLADRFDVKLVRNRCEEFLFYSEQINEVDSFRMAEVYKLSTLQKKCLEKVKKAGDIEKLLSAGASEFSQATLASLLQLSISPNFEHFPESSK